MLVKLSRKTGEGITLDRDIVIEVLSIDGDRVRIGIQAPKEMRIFRKELLEQTVDLKGPVQRRIRRLFRLTHRGSKGGKALMHSLHEGLILCLERGSSRRFDATSSRYVTAPYG